MKNLMIIILLLVLFSCKNNEKRTAAEKIVAEWIGKEIRFPDKFQCNLSGEDTASVVCSGLLDKEYKILLYVDSLGCTSCKLHLFDWKQLIEEANGLFNEQLSFLFFFHPKDKKELQFLFKRDRMDYPVFIDDDNAINRLNHFPEQPEYQCFLLDKNNRVLMIGNPALNPKIWELYKQAILGKEEKQEETTTIETDKTVFDFGNIKINTKNKAVFSVKNTGDAPLIIQRVSASCGCTTVDWEKQPIESGKITEIKIEMNPEEESYFNKTIDVYCDTKESPVKLTIKGIVNK
ncbi:hypothetical protein AGMMS50239_12480 [Bacteroidia bacterium]|nr:hypothetical protein AGMMS50239_12480 [Bacteroidia bacterium]